MGLADDLLLIRAQLETDVRTAWGFAAGDSIHFVPMEIEPTGQRYAVIMRQAMQEDPETAGIRGQSRIVCSFSITGAFKRPLSGNDRDAFLLHKLQAIRDQLHATQHYADISSLHYCRGYEFFIGETADQWDRLTVEFEVTLIYTRTG